MLLVLAALALDDDDDDDLDPDILQLAVFCELLMNIMELGIIEGLMNESERDVRKYFAPKSDENSSREANCLVLKMFLGIVKRCDTRHNTFSDFERVVLE